MIANTNNEPNKSTKHLIQTIHFQRMAELVVTIYIRIIAASQSRILNNDMWYVKIERRIDAHARVKVKF